MLYLNTMQMLATAGIASPETALTDGALETAAEGTTEIAETETFYRTMSQADFLQLTANEVIPATAETFISPSLEYASLYQGVTVRFTVNPGTTESLLGIGVRNAGLTGNPYAALPIVRSGWTSANAFFKLEGGVVNIGLGRGSALQIFNDNIVNFAAVAK
jgi:hypothetical protein